MYPKTGRLLLKASQLYTIMVTNGRNKASILRHKKNNCKDTLKHYLSIIRDMKI